MANSSPTRFFGFDEDIVDNYTRGACWYLALALHNKTGLPLTAIWGEDTIHHVGVELPNGDIVDVDGVWTSNHWSGYWYDELDMCDDIEVGEPSMEDSNWADAFNAYDESMLTVDEGFELNLDEVSNLIIDILNRYELITPQAA